ncbi:hypothetical protein V6N12_002905 [Hibiscus sabdariffa]|uniref:Uncharacterized protein n=1 Tax=Hibiscus sabdariffa TaxID=183260 RepID=A0ABR2EAC5_9ROSI
MAGGGGNGRPTDEATTSSSPMEQIRPDVRGEREKERKGGEGLGISSRGEGAAGWVLNPLLATFRNANATICGLPQRLLAKMPL